MTIPNVRGMLTKIGYDGVPWLHVAHPLGPLGTVSNLSGAGMSPAQHVAVVWAMRNAGAECSLVLTSKEDFEDVKRCVEGVPVEAVDGIPPGWSFHVDYAYLVKSLGTDWRAVFCTAPSYEAIKEMS